MSSKGNNKRIAKNAIVLYFRMILTMAVALYTSRVILKALGVEDYGIYNVVAGVVAMVGIIKGAMTGASTRFLNIALGKEDITLANKYFSVSLSIYFILSVVAVIIGETLGLWFLNTQLIIPEERIVAANYIYQFSILTLVNSLTAIPYSAAIVAHEKMGVYAYLGITESAIKLLIAFLLMYVSCDRLILYGLLMLFSEIVIRLISRAYCIKRYSECKYRLYKDKATYIEILSYSGWNLLGVVSTMIKGQGLNILLNMFFNPVVNAARGISYQVNHAIVQLGTNFYTAVRPQVIKNYARGDTNEMFKLVFWSSKITLYLMAIISLPVFIDADNIIKLWLGNYPDHTIEFVRYMIIISVFDTISYPIATSIQATGKVAVFQIVVAIMTFLNIPVSYILLTLGFPPVTVYQVSLIIQAIMFVARLFLLDRLIRFPIIEYLKVMIGRGFVSVLMAFAIAYYIHTFMGDSIISMILFILISIVISGSSFYLLGLSKEERTSLDKLIVKAIHKHKA